MFGSVFNRFGATTKTLYEAPTTKNLQGVDVYIIVDADNVADNPTPNYMSEKDAKAIYDWVKKGGVLLLFHNDSGNCDFKYIKSLTHRFGFEYNEVSKNKVEGKKYEMGAVKFNGYFESAKCYLKEISTIKADGSFGYHEMSGQNYDAYSNICLFVYKVGAVFAVGDPWLYNEYVDGRKLPAEYENFKAANDLVRWALTQNQKAKVKSKK